MDQHTLLLLGLLRTQAQHGYQLLDFIDRNLSRMTRLKKPTAYAMLDRLYKDGLVDVRIEQEGNRPPRKVFELTRQGETRFAELLRETLSSLPASALSGDVALMFLDQLPATERLKCLKQRLDELETQIRELETIPDHMHSSGVNFALEQQRVMLHANRDWHANLIKQLE